MRLSGMRCDARQCNAVSTSVGEVGVEIGRWAWSLKRKQKRTAGSFGIGIRRGFSASLLGGIGDWMHRFAVPFHNFFRGNDRRFHASLRCRPGQGWWPARVLAGSQASNPHIQQTWTTEQPWIHARPVGTGLPVGASIVIFRLTVLKHRHTLRPKTLNYTPRVRRNSLSLVIIIQTMQATTQPPPQAQAHHINATNIKQRRPNHQGPPSLVKESVNHCLNASKPPKRCGNEREKASKQANASQYTKKHLPGTIQQV